MKFTTSALLGLLLCCQCALAQSQETAEKENRLSIGLMGGVTSGHLNLGRYLQEEYKNFDVGEQLNSTVGFNIRYVATRDIALQSNIMLGKFSLYSDYYHQENLSFKNNYITSSITTQLSLIRLLGAKSDYVNLYGSFGGGVMVNDVSVSTTSKEVAGRGITPSDHPSSTFFSTFGGGIRFNLGYRLDSYAQYDFHSASRDIIDGNFIGDLLAVNGAAETANSWSTVTVGLQYKFGSGSADADWPGVALRPSTPATTPERDVFEQLEDLLTRQAEHYEREMDQLAKQVEALQAELAEERRRREEEERREEERRKEEEEDAYAAIIREMQSRIDSLEKALAEERKIAEPPVGQDEEAVTEGDLKTEIAEAEVEEKVEVEEEVAAVFEEINIEIKNVQPHLIGTQVREIKPVAVQFAPSHLTPVTMDDLLGLLFIPEEEPVADEVADGAIEEIEAEELQVEEFDVIITEDEVIETEVIAAEEEAARDAEPGQEEVIADALPEDITPEITFDDIMEFARSILIEETIAAGEEETEEEVLAEVYEKITEQQPEIRLLADSLTIIHALNELKRGLEEDSTLTISELPDTKIEEPRREPKEVKAEGVLAEMLDERALKTGVAPEVTEEDLIVEHPAGEYLRSRSETLETPANETLPETEDEFTEADVSDVDSPIRAVTPDVDTPADADQTVSEEETDAREEITEPEDRSSWPLFALIAALFAALIFYLAKFFRTEKDLDE